MCRLVRTVQAQVQSFSNAIIFVGFRSGAVLLPWSRRYVEVTHLGLSLVLDA